MINGENIIYHYIQKTLLNDSESDDFSKELIERLIIDLAIWFPKNVYEQVPLLLPYVVRDSSCRRKNPLTKKHEWGFSNEHGFLRDDNSLIKGIIKPLYVHGQKVKEYDGKKLANGFVACHVWRELLNGETRLASTVPSTNSFVPNLVWLPKQISKLTDREGSYAQNLLKTISYKIYFEGSDSNSFTDEIWKFLNNPKLEPKTKIEPDNLNYFIAPQDWINKRKLGLTKEMYTIIDAVDSNQIENKKVKCSSYLPTLISRLSHENKTDLVTWLILNLEQLNNGRQHGL